MHKMSTTCACYCFYKHIGLTDKVKCTVVRLVYDCSILFDLLFISGMRVD